MYPFFAADPPLEAPAAQDVTKRLSALSRGRPRAIESGPCPWRSCDTRGTLLGPHLRPAAADGRCREVDWARVEIPGEGKGLTIGVSVHAHEMQLKKRNNRLKTIDQTRYISEHCPLSRVINFIQYTYALSAWTTNTKCK